jgi:hypothetical protein
MIVYKSTTPNGAVHFCVVTDDKKAIYSCAVSTVAYFESMESLTKSMKEGHWILTYPDKVYINEIFEECEPFQTFEEFLDKYPEYLI